MIIIPYIVREVAQFAHSIYNYYGTLIFAGKETHQLHQPTFLN